MTETRKSYRDLAGALAADRSTNFLPVLIAEGIFVFTIVLAFVKTASSPPGREHVINGFSIAQSALYYWILPAVLLSSIIGVSQSLNARPRILEDVVKVSSIDKHLLSGEELSSVRGMTDRRALGGIFSWQPGK